MFLRTRIRNGLRLSIFLSILWFPVYSSHFVGGEISYTTVGNGVYNVTLTMYKDCGSSSAGYPTSISLSMKDAISGSTLSSATLSPGSEISIPNSFTAACVSNVPSFCVSKKYYTGTLTYTGTVSNGFIFTYSDCCRNSSISNINAPGSASITYRTYTTPSGTSIANSTPVFNLPPTIVASNIQTNTSFSATDSDGDSLYYELTNALDNSLTTSVNYVTGFSGSNPLLSNPAASLNGTTGVLTANVTTQGQYVIAIKLSEYRSGVLITETHRDYQLNIALLNPLTINVDSRFKPIGCSGDDDGVIGVTVTNATLPITYAWSNGGTTSSISGLSPGTYTVICTDASGCVDSTTIGLLNPDSLNIFSIVSPTSCEEVSNGEINITYNGGRAPLTFYLDSIISSANMTGLSSGIYHVIVSDSANLCSVDTTITLPHDTLWNNTIVKSYENPKCSYSNDGNIKIDGYGSNNLFWIDNASSLSTRTGLAPNIYYLEVSNLFGCRDTLSVELIAPAPIQFTPIINEERCFGDETGTIDLNPIGGTPPYTVTWQGTSNTGTPLQKTRIGTYYPLLIDANNCQLNDVIEIYGPDTFYVEIMSKDPRSCSSPDGVIEVTAFGGYQPYSYILNGQPNSNPMTSLIATDHSIQILDDNLCVISKDITLEKQIDLSIFIPNAFTPGNDQCNEVLEIKGDPACFTAMKFSIFDRWGNRLFQTAQPFNEFWDGMNDIDESFVSGVYIYTFESIEYNTKGTITLIR